MTKQIDKILDKILNRRDRKRVLETFLLITATVLSTHSAEVEKFLTSYGIKDYIATIIVFMVADVIRRSFAPKLIETNTMTSTTIETTEPMQETLSPDTTTNDTTDTPAIQG